MISIDPRIGSVDLLEGLEKLTGGQAKLAKPQLESGDVAFMGSGPDGDAMIGIERKRVSDFLGSMRSNRLSAEQIPAMLETYQFIYIIVEGPYRPSSTGLIETWQGKTRGWAPVNLSQNGRGNNFFHYSEMDKHLASIEVKRNIMLRRTGSRLETCHVIANLYAWWQKPWDSHVSLEAVKFQPGILPIRSSLLRRVAAELDSVGWEISAHIDRAFKSVEEFANALPSEIAEVSWVTKTGRNMKIGTQKSLRIYGELHGIRTDND